MKPLPLTTHMRATLARLEPGIASARIEHLYVIDSRGRVVAHRTGTHNRVKAGRKLTEWMAEHPLGFITTHNHPRSTAHSRRDVENAMRRFAVESRVVTKDRVFRVQPRLQLRDAPNELYEFQARLDAAAGRMTEAERIDHLVRLYARGIKRVRLPPLVRYGFEPLPAVRHNPHDACCVCSSETVHLSTTSR